MRKLLNDICKRLLAVQAAAAVTWFVTGIQAPELTAIVDGKTSVKNELDVCSRRLVKGDPVIAQRPPTLIVLWADWTLVRRREVRVVVTSALLATQTFDRDRKFL